MPGACDCEAEYVPYSKSESGTNDPFAIFFSRLSWSRYCCLGGQTWSHALVSFVREAVLGSIIGFAGGQIIVLVLNRMALTRGLYAPFVAVSALVVFRFRQCGVCVGVLAVCLAGLVVGNNHRQYTPSCRIS